MAEDPTKLLLRARHHTHGDFDEVSRITLDTLDVWKKSHNWDKLRPRQRMSLMETAHKVARILSGNPDHEDHWDDVGGYAKLGKTKPADGSYS